MLIHAKTRIPLSEQQVDVYTARAAIWQQAPTGCRVVVQWVHRRLAGVDDASYEPDDESSCSSQMLIRAARAGCRFELLEPDADSSTSYIMKHSIETQITMHSRVTGICV
jgi:hypothetical protein